MRKLFVLALAVAALSIATTQAGAVTNGQPDGTNHPYVGLAVFDVNGAPSHRCTASLLSPTIVLTAGHCTDGTSAARVSFDEIVEGNPELTRSAAQLRTTVSHTPIRTSASPAVTACRVSPSATSASSCCPSRCRRA